MEPKNIEGFELELEIKVEELEERIAPGELVWPFPGGGKGGGGGHGGRKEKSIVLIGIEAAPNVAGRADQ